MIQGKFEDLGISEDVLRAVRSAGWTEPTPVQIATVPAGLGGKDLLVRARTGTGKTGAYGSIILSRTEAGSTDPASLVLVPARGLAGRVAEELGRLSKYSGHTSLPICGGTGTEDWIKRLKKGADIVVATPEELKSLIERGVIAISGISIVVLDETDRMLGMGFGPIVSMILNRLPKERQTMMFSAAVPDTVRKMAARHMINCKEILIPKDRPAPGPATQYFIMTDRDSKRDVLISLLGDGCPKAAVFCRTKNKADHLARRMRRDGFSCGGIHEGVGQSERERIVQEFRDGDIKILIASDAASRGLDIDGADIAVSYDVPADPKTYVCRIGAVRTGGAGKAVTLATKGDVEKLRTIEKTVGRHIAELSSIPDGCRTGPEEDPGGRAKGAGQHSAAKKTTAETVAGASGRAAGPKDAAEKSKADGRKKIVRILSGALDRPARGGPKNVPKVAAEGPKPHGERKSAQKKGPPGKEKMRSASANGRPIYIPQGIPENPRPLHAYVQIDRAPAPERDVSMDRLELSIGENDGATVDSLSRFIVKVAGISLKDIGNIHIYPEKSRIQVVRYRSQEVVDEVFGQTFRNKRRVLVTNLSDRKM